jgi:hypothetical protein
MSILTLSLYSLSVLTCLACTALLYRAYLKTGQRLLLWSTLCFVGLSVNNVLLFVDLVVYPTEIDLRTWRLGGALVGMVFLLYGFIWEAEEERP